MAFSLNTISLKERGWTISLNLLDQFHKMWSNKGLTVLSVSLVNDRFRAMSIINDHIHKSWEKPGIFPRAKSLYDAISEAITQTEFPGTQISILVEDPRCMALTIQLPIMSDADLIPILERKAQQIKTWEGPVIWRHRLGMQARERVIIPLELWPQDFINDIVQHCQDLDLQLQQLSRLSALSDRQLGNLSIASGEATILISIIAGKVSFIAGGEDGVPILTRHLAPTQDWVPLGKRIGTEVNRTIMFITQQLNVNIPHIWFLSEDEQLTLEEVQPHVSTPIFPCPIKPDWKYWLWVGATLPRNLSNNFTPLDVQRAPLKKVLTKTLAAMVLGFLIISIGATGFLEGYFSQNKQRLEFATAQAMSLQEDQDEWSKRLVTLHTKNQWARAITETKVPSLEGPLLSYLGNVLPPQMILYKAVITRTNDRWDLSLAGKTSANLPDTLQLVDALVRQLAQGPYHVTVQEDWREQLLDQTSTQTSKKESLPDYQWSVKGHFS